MGWATVTLQPGPGRLGWAPVLGGMRRFCEILVRKPYESLVVCPNHIFFFSIIPEYFFFQDAIFQDHIDNVQKKHCIICGRVMP